MLLSFVSHQLLSVLSLAALPHVTSSLSSPRWWSSWATSDRRPSGFWCPAFISTWRTSRMVSVTIWSCIWIHLLNGFCTHQVELQWHARHSVIVVWRENQYSIANSWFWVVHFHCLLKHPQNNSDSGSACAVTVLHCFKRLTLNSRHLISILFFQPH